MQTQFKDLDPPLRVAWTQALASIRVRFLRMVITSLGVALGIAFFSSMEVLRMGPPKATTESPEQMSWLVGTALVMCLVGVTNSMLMSVTERYREIGTIKCLGASDNFIVKVFFFEAMLLGLIGSASGAVVGSALMSILMSATGHPPRFTVALTVVGLGTVVGLVMTVLAAIAPAVQASRMPAAAALRVDV